MTDWRYHPVYCAECGNALMRRLLRPKDSAPIIHFFCDRVCKGAWQRRQKPVGAAWLRQKYEVEGLNCPQIAAIVNRDAKSVWNWLRGYGIATRTRGSDPLVQFKKGHIPAFAGKQHTTATKARLRELSLADGRVPYLKNGAHHLAGKRGAETPNWRGGVTPERQRFYETPEWKAARKQAYIAASGKCQRCGCSHSHANPLHVHHVMPFWHRPLRCAVRNLRVLCAVCHRFVHSRLNGDREFLPPFGVFPITNDGVVHLVRINYFPKQRMEFPPWMRSAQ